MDNFDQLKGKDTVLINITTHDAQLHCDVMTLLESTQKHEWNVSILCFIVFFWLYMSDGIVFFQFNTTHYDVLHHIFKESLKLTSNNYYIPHYIPCMGNFSIGTHVKSIRKHRKTPYFQAPLLWKLIRWPTIFFGPFNHIWGVLSIDTKFIRNSLQVWTVYFPFNIL